MDEFNALVQGYNDKLIDLQVIAAQIGYWSGYYQSKRPKSISTISENIMSNKLKSYKSTKKSVPDVESFKAKDLRYQNYLSKMGVK